MTTATDTPLYCLKCKERTPNLEPAVLVTTSNGRPMLRAKCATPDCGRTKSQFTSAAAAAK